MPNLKQLEEYHKRRGLNPSYKSTYIKSNTIPERIQELDRAKREINQNLDQLKYNNFWTQPYSNFSGEQAVELGTNLIKESLYTGVGDILANGLVNKVSKLIPKKTKRFDKMYQRQLNIKDIDKSKLDLDKVNQYYNELLDYSNSPDLRNKLQQIDKELGTKYTETLNLINKHRFDIRYNPYFQENAALSYSLDDLSNLNNHYIMIGDNLKESSLIHEFRHQLELLESVIRNNKQGVKFNNKVEVNRLLATNPREKLLFNNNLKSSQEAVRDLVQNNPDWNLLDGFEYNAYIRTPSELNSQFTPIIRKELKNNTYNSNITIDDFKRFAQEAVEEENDYSPRGIFKYFIKNQSKFITDWNKYKYLTPLITKYGQKNIKSEQQ